MPSLEVPLEYVVEEGTGCVPQRLPPGKTWMDVVNRTAHACAADVTLLDPDRFQPGNIHHHVQMWDKITQGFAKRQQVMNWVRNKIRLSEFFTRYEGRYEGVYYAAEEPPEYQCRNHIEDELVGPHRDVWADDWVEEQVHKMLAAGAVRRVSSQPHIVTPLGVEPTKPRFLMDCRFLNLWCLNPPTVLGGLKTVPGMVHIGKSFIASIDEKSAYWHEAIHADEQKYFGFWWRGQYYVCTVLPFGWTVSVYVHQTFGEAIVHYMARCKIPLSVWIDDFFLTGFQGDDPAVVSPWQSCHDAVFVLLSVLTELGYFVSITKSVLRAVQILRFLGVMVDVSKGTFTVPQDKIDTLMGLVGQALVDGEVQLRVLERIVGKCMAMQVAVPAAKLYCRAMYSLLNASGALFVSRSGRDGQRRSRKRRRLSMMKFVDLTDEVVEEFQMWLNLPAINGSAWLFPSHVRVVMQTDASQRRWGGLFCPTLL